MEFQEFENCRQTFQNMFVYVFMFAVHYLKRLVGRLAMKLAVDVLELAIRISLPIGH
jgi:hypothetical protein